MVYAGSQTSSRIVAQKAGLSTTTTETGFYSQKQREVKAARNTDNEGQGDAGTSPVSTYPVSETTADNNSYGFRPERSTADARQQCFNALAKEISPQWILEGDIKGCFDNISHKWILENVPTDKATLQKWLKAGYVYKDELFPTEAGTPQGGIISPTLANLTLDGLEAVLRDKFGEKTTAKSKRNQVNFVRYADDFIITGKTKELLGNEVKPLVENFLKERGETFKYGS